MTGRRPDPTRLGQAIGVDIGGTKIAAGLVDAGGRIAAEVRCPTPEPAQIVDAVAQLIEQLDHPLVPVGVGVASLVDLDGTLLAATNLPGIDVHLGRTLAERLDCAVTVDNDAAVAAWGEHCFGAGRGRDNLIMVTIGTGVGGGIVWRGELLRGARGQAAEFGHLCVVPDGLPCGCGRRGCLEQYASGRALDRGVSVAEAADWLGRGLASLIAVLDPGIIVIGGGVADLGEELMVPLRAALDAHITNPRERIRPELTLAALGNTAGIVGAADLARR